MSDLVSICIPAFERVELLRSCIESVLAQTYRNIAVHVFDNSKTEDVRELIELLNDGRIHYERNGPNTSDLILVNLLKAFAPQAGRYQMILTSDWELRPDAIERMVAALQADDGIVAVISGYEHRHVATGHISLKPQPLKEFVTDGSLDTRKLLYASLHGLSGIGFCYHALIETDVLRLIDPVYYGQASEHEIALDLAIIKPRIGVINECLLIGHMHDQHFTSGKRRYKHLSETAARARFFDRRYPELVAKGFDTERMQRGLVRRFVRSAFADPAHAGNALMFAKRYGLPWLFGVVLWWILLPLRAFSSVRKTI